MMGIKKETYLAWQNKLITRKWYRWFWLWWGIYSILLVFVIAIYLLTRGQWREVLMTLLSFILARGIASPIIYYFYKKERPYQVLKFTPFHSRLFSEPTVRFNAFPSDHALSFASITTVLFWFYPALGLFMIVVSLINGWARMVLGYHYFWHVLWGWVVGTLSGLAVIYWLAPVVLNYH